MPDGIYLLNLLMCLGEKKRGSKKIYEPLKIPEPKPKNPFQCHANLNKALDFLKKQNVKLVNIGSEDLYQSNEKLVMGLVWTIILYFEAGDYSRNIGSEILGKWNKILKEEYDKFGVAPLTSYSDESVLDGRAFKVLGYHFVKDDERDQLSEFQKNPADKAKHFDEAMHDGDKFLGVPILLDGKDLQDTVDDKAIMTQALQFLAMEYKQDQDELLKRELNKKLEKALEAKEMANSINSKINDNLNGWIKKVTGDLSDNSQDQHPDIIDQMDSYLNNHFSNEKPPKSDMYNEIVNDVSKLKSLCISKELPIPKTNIQELNGLWKNLSLAEREKIQHQSYMRNLYQQVRQMKIQFDRRAEAIKRNCHEAKQDCENISTKSKVVSVHEIDDIEINSENLDSQLATLRESFGNLEKFVEEKCKPSCPCPAYFDECFTSQLKHCNDEIDSVQSSKSKADKDFEDAKERCQKIKKNLKENYKEFWLDSMRFQDAEIFLKSGLEEQFTNLIDLDGFVEEIHNIPLQSLENGLQQCQGRDDENAKLSGGSPVTNPYTKTTTGDLTGRIDALKKMMNDAKTHAEAQKPELVKVEKLFQSFKAETKLINEQLEIANDKITAANNSNADLQSVIADLNAIKEELEPPLNCVKLLKDKVAGQQALIVECHRIMTNIEDCKITVNKQIDALSTKSSVEEDEGLLTDEEKQKIKKAFTLADTTKSGKLNKEVIFCIKLFTRFIFVRLFLSVVS